MSAPARLSVSCAPDRRGVSPHPPLEMGIRLHLLGVPQTRNGEGSELLAITRSPKIVALLAYLALTPPGRGRRRDALTALLWPERDHLHARHALRQLLSRLRRIVGPGCLTCDSDETVYLDPNHVWCDARAFEDALAAGRLREALSLYRGPLLDAFHLVDAADFDLWAAENRERLLRRALGAAEDLAGLAREGGDPAGEVHWLTRALELDPYSEGRSDRLVMLLLETGERGAAARERERLARRLQEDLGIEIGVRPIPGVAFVGNGSPDRPWESGPPRRSGEDDTRRGRYHFQRWSCDAIERSLTHFSRAISIDPRASAPYAGLAMAYATLGHFGHLPPEVAFPRAEREAVRALEIESGEADAHLALGMKAHLYDRDVGVAHARMHAAREAAPDHPLPHWALGLLHASLEQTDDARESMRRARLLDPLSLPVAMGEAWVRIGAGDMDQAERTVWNTLELDPESPHALWQLGIVRVMQGHARDAVPQLRRAVSRSPQELLILASLGHALAVAGDEAESRLILRRLQQARAGGRYVSPLASAMVHAGRGEDEECRRWLERAVSERDGLIAFLGTWPFVRSLRREPWFQSLTDRLFAGRTGSGWVAPSPATGRAPRDARVMSAAC